MKLHKHIYIPWANIYGDLINHINKRGVMRCKICGKIKFVSELLPVDLSYNEYLEKTAQEHFSNQFDKL